MPTSFLEIVELPDGDFALRRSGEENAPLVRISFSREARDMLQDNDLTVAKAMITAGIEMAGSLSENMDIEGEEADDDEEAVRLDEQHHTLH